MIVGCCAVVLACLDSVPAAAGERQLSLSPAVQRQAKPSRGGSNSATSIAFPLVSWVPAAHCSLLLQSPHLPRVACAPVFSTCPVADHHPPTQPASQRAVSCRV